MEADIAFFDDRGALRLDRLHNRHYAGRRRSDLTFDHRHNAALGAMRCDVIPVRVDFRGPAALDNGLVIEVEPGRFEDMVITALDGLPEELGQLMRNVAVTVEHRPGPPGLLGLYEGIPLTSRTSQYAGVLPDRITIYRQAICAICRTEQEVDDQGDYSFIITV